MRGIPEGPGPPGSLAAAPEAVQVGEPLGDMGLSPAQVVEVRADGGQVAKGWHRSSSQIAPVRSWGVSLAGDRARVCHSASRCLQALLGWLPSSDTAPTREAELCSH